MPAPATIAGYRTLCWTPNKCRQRWLSLVGCRTCRTRLSGASLRFGHRRLVGDKQGWRHCCLCGALAFLGGLGIFNHGLEGLVRQGAQGNGGGFNVEILQHPVGVGKFKGVLASGSGASRVLDPSLFAGIDPHCASLFAIPDKRFRYLLFLGAGKPYALGTARHFGFAVISREAFVY